MEFPLNINSHARPRATGRRGEVSADALRAERDADATMSHNWHPDAGGRPAGPPPAAATGGPPARPGLGPLLPLYPPLP